MISGIDQYFCGMSSSIGQNNKIRINGREPKIINNSQYTTYLRLSMGFESFNSINIINETNFDWKIGKI